MLGLGHIRKWFVKELSCCLLMRRDYTGWPQKRAFLKENIHWQENEVKCMSLWLKYAWKMMSICTTATSKLSWLPWSFCIRVPISVCSMGCRFKAFNHSSEPFIMVENWYCTCAFTLTSKLGHGYLLQRVNLIEWEKFSVFKTLLANFILISQAN